jgi:hypothetical protein
MQELQRERSRGERAARGNELSVRNRTDMAKRTGGRVVSAMDLAAALQDGPENSELDRPHRKLKVTVVVMLLLAGSAAALLYFKPEYRRPTYDWLRNTWSTVKMRAASLEWPEARPQKHEPIVIVPADPRAQSPAPPAPAVVNETRTGIDPDRIIITAPPETEQTRPAQQSSPQARSQPEMPPPSPAGASARNPAEHAVPPAREPAAIDLASARSEARRLWAEALQAQSQKDFAAELRCYEQIKQLPQNVWQKNLDLYMDEARRQLQQSASR